MYVRFYFSLFMSLRTYFHINMCPYKLVLVLMLTDTMSLPTSRDKSADVPAKTCVISLKVLMTTTMSFVDWCDPGVTWPLWCFTWTLVQQTQLWKFYAESVQSEMLHSFGVNCHNFVWINRRLRLSLNSRLQKLHKRQNNERMSQGKSGCWQQSDRIFICHFKSCTIEAGFKQPWVMMMLSGIPSCPLDSGWILMPDLWVRTHWPREPQMKVMFQAWHPTCFCSLADVQRG